MRKHYQPSPLAQVSQRTEGDEAVLIFVRELRHPPAKVWRALVDPTEQGEWMPFVANRVLDTVGPARLRMTDTADGSESEAEVVRSEPGRLLSYRWGDDLLTWELAPIDSGTRLTLSHRTRLPGEIASFAAGWHICLDVAERFLDGQPIGPIVGMAAMDHGWATLNAPYRARLGLDPPG